MSFDSQIHRNSDLGIVVDFTHTDATESDDVGPSLAAISALEAGATANVDEGRQVGHYWLRTPSKAPDPAVAQEIRETIDRILTLKADNCDTVLMLGVGGSALGPELAIDALQATGTRQFLLIDTVDPSGVKRTLAQMNPSSTVVLVASKSGGTAETRQVLRIVEATYAKAGVCFADHAIAITSPGSALEDLAKGWRDIFPVWEWVGGRTSVTSPIGLIPMHLCGIDIMGFLQGAREMDSWTRLPFPKNPAALLASVWVDSKENNLAVIPYCDRLRHLSRYLQQLIMESLGKALDRTGAQIHAGLTVFGNKGSADQHAIVQQLRDGPDNVMLHFIECSAGPEASPLMSDAADLQFALLSGTRDAMVEVGRPTVSITIPKMNAKSLGALIALFERTVGIAAELIDINAYNQPGVEAGKKAARFQLDQLIAVEKHLGPTSFTAKEVANTLGLDPHTVWRLCTHLTTTGRAESIAGKSPSEDLFRSI